ncbi:MAG: shikimate kinase [Anaerolineae bacterium]|nr:shikimate kinase [Anaerolineae bacterium]
MGTGKSTIGRAVAERLGWRFADSDEAIVARAGLSIAQIFEQWGEPEFRQLEREVVQALIDDDEVVIATGGGSLIDERTRTYALAHALVICLMAAPDAIEARLADDMDRPLLRGDWRALLERRRPIYESIPYQIDTTGKQPEQIVEEVLRTWRNAST